MTTLNSTVQVKEKKLRVGRGIGSGKGKTSGRPFACQVGKKLGFYF